MRISKSSKLYKNLKTDIQICYSANSIIKIVESLAKLAQEENSIVLADSTFYSLTIDEFKQGLVMRVGRLYDNDTRSESIQELVRTLCSNSSIEPSDGTRKAIGDLVVIENSEQVRTNLQFRNKMYAHVDKSREITLQDLILPIKGYKYIFGESLKALNVISSSVFKEVTADGYSGDDFTLAEMRWLEKAKATRRYIELYEVSDHPSLTYKIGT